MQNLFTKSVVARITILMAMVILITVTAIFFSVFISDRVDSDAAVINLSGSMRMHNYRMLAKLEESIKTGDEQLFKNSIDRFDDVFEHPLFQYPSPRNSKAIRTAFIDIKQQWLNEIHPSLIQAFQQKATSAELTHLIDDYVDKIDRLVHLYQVDSEKKVRLLRTVGITALFVMVLVVLICIYSIHVHIKEPLANLTRTAKQLSNGDFTARASVDQEDELGILARTLNRSSQVIGDMYSQQEKRVKEKTRDLKRSNDSLTLLFDVARTFNETKLDDMDFHHVIKCLSDVSGVQDIDLCLMTASGESAYNHLVTQRGKKVPENCLNGSCYNCIEGQKNHITESDYKHIKYPLLHDQIEYGVLICTIEENNELEEWQHQLVTSVADQIATALAIRDKIDQSRRLSLMQERTIIARELHDSLAQSLSYLKIQVSMLQKILSAETHSSEKTEKVVAELKEGLGSAYRQLRELLTTFRLKITGPGLRAAIQETVESQRERTHMSIQLEFGIDDLPFTPNEEIHLLQITREALQNAVHHSKGDQIKVRFYYDAEKTVHLEVSDNGVGMPNSPEKLNHYGLAIMQERGRSLSGDLKIAPAFPNGTQVHFQFTPNYAASVN
ncbi:histidine kinase [Teredinibacter sp. KSP-S5-2]|uniref:histidine kinase n=1 Tax=Teredinibacter sp. KSP-S5-2 TaxID=3034506 RepID=UPI0029349F07|nr:histidine kinase [Teredinibacter sp. KSP-S5-2]WNO10736.1 histidine kinase [Teredinibacter sp. KSP-S5-2]